MAASTISPATLATPREQRRHVTLRIAGSALDYWHLLSLDAPTVAVVWTLSFAAALHVNLPVLGPMMLALATWLIYVADRLLDAAGPAQTGSLQTRHHFHHRYRTVFFIVAAGILPLLAWLVISRLEPAPLREDLVLAGCSLVYLLCIHFPLGVAARTHIRLPKELIVGIIFAAACGIPTWSRDPMARPLLFLPLCLFACLCWINCVAIEYWESSVESSVKLHRSTLWLGRHFKVVTGSLAGLAAATLLVSMPAHNAALVALLLSVSASSSGLAWLHHRRRTIDPLRLRAAADAVLLAPAILVPVSFFVARSLHLK